MKISPSQRSALDDNLGIPWGLVFVSNLTDSKEFKDIAKPSTKKSPNFDFGEK